MKLKRPVPKLPSQGWNFTIDGYTFIKPTEDELVAAVERYMRGAGHDATKAKQLIEEHLCAQNPHLSTKQR